MELLKTILPLTIILSTNAEFQHEAYQFESCSDSDEEFFIGFEEEEVWHIDFDKKRGVETSPNFTKSVKFPGFYEIGVSNAKICKSGLHKIIKQVKIPPQMDAPQTSIYPKNIVQLGVENTLVCHVTGFYPPSLSISWTKNNANVTEGISLSQYRPKTDGTFNIFSTLKFAPAEGDIYSCTVNHRALQGQLQTKTWDVDVALPSVGPTVVCGLGLSLGLLGVTIGTFFIIKGYIEQRQ